ncbi:MAG: hypothetical protein ACREPK_06225 [Rhodanobacteraceae bacterium]
MARVGLDWHASKGVSVGANYEDLWGGGTKGNAVKLRVNVVF